MIIFLITAKQQLISKQLHILIKNWLSTHKYIN